MNLIDLTTFAAADLRVGTVVRAETFPEARKPAYRLWIDFGELGIRTSSAQITERYEPQDLLGTQVIAVVNLSSRQIANFMSECLVIGAVTKGEGVVVLRPDSPVENGTPIA